MKWYTRLILSLGVAMAAAIVSALVLTFVDLYLVGHNYQSLNVATISIPRGWRAIEPI